MVIIIFFKCVKTVTLLVCQVSLNVHISFLSYTGGHSVPPPPGIRTPKSPGLIELSADDKYSPLNRDSLTQPIQIQLSEKQNSFSLIFLYICAIYKNEDTHSWCIYKIMDSEKTGLDNSLKSPVSEDPSTSNMLNGLKHCWNLNDSSFTIFIDHWERNWVGKSLSYRYAKS